MTGGFLRTKVLSHNRCEFFLCQIIFLIFDCRISQTQNQCHLSSIEVSRHFKIVKCVCANSVAALCVDRLCWAGLPLLSPVAGSRVVTVTPSPGEPGVTQEYRHIQ